MKAAQVEQETTGNHPGSKQSPKATAVGAARSGRPLTFNDVGSPALRLDHAFGSSHASLPPGLQAKLTVNAPGDQFELEADRVADQIMRVPDSTNAVESKSDYGRFNASPESGKSCSREPGLVQRQVASQTDQTPTAPGIAHEVWRRPGLALDDTTRLFFEKRFQHDFRDVRIHADAAAAESARGIDARAYTIGRDVVFGPGEFAPNTAEGKHLLAHELTHVVQQSSISQPGSTTERSRPDYSRAKPQAVRQSPPARIQRSAVTFRGRTFEVGDVHLNAQAATDVNRHGVLLPGPDQAHLLVTNTRQLGYEVSHTTPDDPFRWARLKEIVDTGHADISGVSSTQNFPAREVRAGVSRIVQNNLLLFQASGITLPRLSLQQALRPNAPSYTASANNSRDSVFYETGASGRGMLGGNSLAHELFGHLWLAMKGVPFAHGGQLTAAQSIMDPMGRAFTGSVDDYIDRFAGSGQTALQSPTQRVSPAHLTAALTWIQTNGANHLTLLPGNVGSITNAFGLEWETVSGNYDILRVGPQPATPTAGDAASVVTAIVGWFNGLTADQKLAFRTVLSAISMRFGLNRRTRLATDVLAQLPSVAPAQPPGGTP